MLRTAGARRRTPQTGGSDVTLILANATVVTMDGTSRVISPGSVAIDGTRSSRWTRRRHRREVPRTRAHRPCRPIVLPGLVNTHTHAAMVLYRGLADDLALMDWLQKYIFPAEAKTVSPDFVRVGTRLAALEMIRSGTTLFADMYYFEEEVAAAVKEAGMRGVLGQTIIEFPVADARTPAEGLTRAEAFIQRFKNDELVVPAVAPHSMYTLDAATLLAPRPRHNYDVPPDPPGRDAGRGQDVAGTLQDAPAGFLDSIKFWAPSTLGAHGVWITPEEVTMLSGAASASRTIPKAT